MAGILATKLEMTRVIKDDKFIPVTLLQVSAMKVIGLKTVENDGYNALVVGTLRNGAEAELKKDKKALDPSNFSVVKEFDIDEADLAKYKAGDDYGLEALEGVELVEVEGFSKGKGFTGAMKKHNFHGGPGGHGSKFHRALGSIGNRKPTRTHKGKKMHGHHGNIKVSIKKIPVELVNKEISVIAVRGGVPGARNSLVSLNF